MDPNNFDEILKFAIEREIAAATFYTEALEMAFNPSAKEMFAEFAKEEERHRKILEGVQDEGVEAYEIKSVTNLKIADYLIDIEFKPGMPLADIIHLAAKREEKSHRLYSDFAAECNDPKLKKLFEVLATEELKHKNKFEVMYDEQVLSEN